MPITITVPSGGGAGGGANTDGSNITSASTWRANLDVPSNLEAARISHCGVSGVAFDGITSGTRITSPCQNLGTSALSIWLKLRVPDSIGATMRGLAIINTSSTAVGGAGVHLYIASNGVLVWEMEGAVASDYRAIYVSGFDTTYAGKLVDIVVTRNGTTANVYINGTLQSGTTSTGGTPPNWSDSIGTPAYFHVGAYGSVNGFNDRIYRAAVFNRELSQSDVNELIATGIDPADQWGTQTTQYASDFSVGADSWTANANQTVTGNVDTSADGAGVPPTDNWGKCVLSASRTMTFFRNTSLLTVGKRYQATGLVFAPTGSPISHAFFGSGGTLGDPTAASAIVVGTATTVTSEFVAGTVNLTANGNTSTSTTLASVASGTAMYIQSITVKRVGAIIDLDLSVGVGSYFPDRSSNILPGDGSGGISHTVQRTFGLMCVTKKFDHADISATNGTTPFFVQPANCSYIRTEMDRQVAFDATLTLSIGTSATPGALMNAIAISATGLITSSSGSVTSQSATVGTQMYVKKSAASTVGTVVVRSIYEIRH